MGNNFWYRFKHPFALDGMGNGSIFHFTIKQQINFALYKMEIEQENCSLSVLLFAKQNSISFSLIMELLP
jgi:hypothetical protein